MNTYDYERCSHSVRNVSLGSGCHSPPFVPGSDEHRGDHIPQYMVKPLFELKINVSKNQKKPKFPNV
jgi:hypothetical protein